MTDPTSQGDEFDGPRGVRGDAARERFAHVAGEQKAQLSGAFEDARGRSLETYGKAMDRLDGLAERAPERFRTQAHSAVAAARKRPLVTTLAVAGLGLLLAGVGRRRR